MEDVKQYLFDKLVEEFNTQPSFLLARTIFLFCHFNSSFEMPRNVEKKFINGLLDDEVRAFSLMYCPGNDAREQEASSRQDKVPAGSLQVEKEEIYRQIAAENLSKGTGKMYSTSMVEKILARYKGIMSYNEILEVFILSGR